MCLYNSSSLGVPECKEFPDTYISHQSFSLPNRSSPAIFSLQGLPTSSPGGSLFQVHQSALTNPKPSWPPGENKLLKAQVCALRAGDHLGDKCYLWTYQTTHLSRLGWCSPGFCNIFETVNVPIRHNLKFLLL